MQNKQKFLRSAIFGQLPIITQLISGFIVMPQLVRFFGDRHYGLWVLVSTFLGYFGLLDLGFSKAIIRYVSKALGDDNVEESNGWITLGLVYLWFSTLIGFVLLGIAWWSCRYFVEEDLALIRMVFLVGGIAFLLAFPSRCADGVLQAHIRADVMEGITSVVNLLRIACFLVLLKFEMPFLFFVGVLAMFSLVRAVVMFLAALRVHHGFRWNFGFMDRLRIKEFFHYSGVSFISMLADLFRFRAFPVIISSFLGLAAVTPFAIAHRARIIWELAVNKVLVNFTPIFSQIEGRSGLGSELRSTYLFAYKLSIYLTLFSGGLLAIIAPPFIERWMGPEHSASTTLLLISLVGGVAARAQTPSICLMFGTSNHRYYALINSLEAILVIVSSILLVSKFGLVGMITGASLSSFVINFTCIPAMAARIVNVSLFNLHMKNTLPSVLKVLVFLSLIYLGSSPFLKANYPIIFAVGILSTVLFIPYIWVIGFSAEERCKLLEAVPGVKKFKILTRLMRIP